MSELDLSYLNELSGGDQDFIHEMIETFLEETPNDVAALESHLAANNWAEVGKTAHKLKSSIKMFGYKSLADLAFTVEQYGKNSSNLDELPTLTSNFITSCNEAMNELRAKL